jgi:hypothetical protein
MRQKKGQNKSKKEEGKPRAIKKQKNKIEKGEKGLFFSWKEKREHIVAM